ncbi:hypothetical protein LOTGIDRAFT_238298 [Lottia gigantea]|uniref:Isopentenyl phosphate kinase n=1 Tax=Lottia gigantea TaxID=225164 RepID=V4AV36_LOTGI|nr:hypothetical protein LOTGIDRAFT_238298 [Lottia gigantea]ESP01168.1 hypothetical protein LOTGIDRAFT_238298 [Lottia gigantea]
MTENDIDLIIKFGGSSITNKDCIETLRVTALEWCAHLVKKCLNSDKNCVIVHGAGSFGHHQAKEYHVSSGYSHLSTKFETDKIKLGFSLTRQSVLKLNASVIENLLKEGIPAISLSPFLSWKTDNRIVQEDGCEMIHAVLNQGYMPVLHGDAVFDKSLGCTILSGDTIIERICEKFEVKKVVFISDVDGIFDKPPNNLEAKLIKHIQVRTDGDIFMDIQTSQSVNDVTGGIKLKLQAAINIVKASPKTTVYISKVSSNSTQDICLNDNLDEKTFDSTKISLKK